MPRPLASHRLTALAALLLFGWNTAQANDGALLRYEKALIEASSQSAQRQMVCAEAASLNKAYVRDPTRPEAQRLRLVALMDRCEQLEVSEPAAQAALAPLRAALLTAMAEDAKRKPKRDPAPSLPAATETQIADLLAKAATAQEPVEEAQKALVDLYGTADKAKAKAATMPGGSVRAKAAVEQAAQLQDRVGKAHASARAAQTQANYFSADALALRRCGLGECPDGDTKQKAFERATQAQKDLLAAKDETNAQAKAVLDTSWEVNAAEAGLDEKERDRYLALEQQLKAFPSARRLMGGDAVTFTAGQDDSQIALKVGGNFETGLLGTKRFAATVSAPVGGSKRTLLFDNDKGFGTSPTLKLSMGSSRAAGIGPFIYNGQLALTLQRVKHEYLTEPAGVPTEASSNSTAKGLEGELGVLGYDTKSFHTFRIRYVEAHKDGAAAIRCPGGTPAAGTSFGCLQGSLGAPTKGRTTTLSYGLNQKIGTFAIAPTYSWKRETHEGLLELPIYLIKNADKEAGGLNAGIQFSWRRTPAQGDKPAKTDTGIGLFIGAPFGLLSGVRTE